MSGHQWPVHLKSDTITKHNFYRDFFFCRCFWNTIWNTVFMGNCVICSGCIGIKFCAHRCQHWLGKKLAYASGNGREWLGVRGAAHQVNIFCMIVNGNLNLDPRQAIRPTRFTPPIWAYSWGTAGLDMMSSSLGHLSHSLQEYLWAYHVKRLWFAVLQKYIVLYHYMSGNFVIIFWPT